MNTLGTILVWCVLQVTLVALATGIAYLLARRRGASLRSSVVLTGLLIATLLIPLAWIPWPRWELPRAPETQNEPPPVLKTINDQTASKTATQPDQTQNIKQPTSIEIEPVTWRTTWNNFVDALENPRSPVSPVSQTPAAPAPQLWPRLVLALFGVALLVALARLAGGYWSVRRTIRAARPVRDSRIVEIADLLRAELSCKVPVELRESHRTGTAATTGWRRPVILLPAGWRGWTTGQTRAVLAHELAHVVRRDYLIGCLAQIGLALHFYHPLWQWLVARLRLEQELAADALAAGVTGGREHYLKNLAELALRRSDAAPSVAWPARAFLPSRHTFLRRIEMLRDPKSTVNRSGPWLRAMSIAALLMLGLVISGIRPGSVVAQNAEPDNATVQEQAGREDVSLKEGEATKASTTSVAAYIPANAMFVVTARPREILNDPALKPHTEEIKELFASLPDLKRNPLLREAGVELDRIESVAFGILDIAPAQHTENNDPMLAIRFSSPVDRSIIAKGASKTIKDLRGVVYQMKSNAYVMIPEDTVVLFAGDQAPLFGMLLSGQVNAMSSPWISRGKQLEGSTLSVHVNTDAIASTLQKVRQANPQMGPDLEFLAPVMPLIHDTNMAGIGLIGEDARLRGYAEADDRVAAERVAETLKALITLGQNAVRQLKSQLDEQSEQDQAFAKLMVPLAEQLLASATVETDGTTVRLSADSGEISPMLALILPAIQQAREAAYRATSQSNLKQIALAFHNYHDTHGFLPPAVIEENGVNRSWRVEILPFLEERDLYEQYRKDEPWDSEHNKMILAKMPSVFRDPSDDSKSNSTSYYLLTNMHALTNARPVNEGAGLRGGFAQPPVKDDRPKANFRALFTNEPIDLQSGGEGPTFGAISDGLSNTILIVEASRDVPWTKPEDIPVDPEKIAELIKEDLGGSHTGVFLGALADGSVRTFSKAISPEIFKKIITPSGGEVIGDF